MSETPTQSIKWAWMYNGRQHHLIKACYINTTAISKQKTRWSYYNGKRTINMCVGPMCVVAIGCIGFIMYLYPLYKSYKYENKIIRLNQPLTDQLSKISREIAKNNPDVGYIRRQIDKLPNDIIH